jgi:hypothetical protein
VDDYLLDDHSYSWDYGPPVNHEKDGGAGVPARPIWEAQAKTRACTGGTPVPP